MKLAIKELRAKVHITQQELAQKIGVTQRTVSSWERGESTPNVEQVWNCSVVFGCTPDEVLCWHTEENIGALSDDEIRLVNNYRNSDQRGRDIILAIAKIEGEREK